MNKPLQTNLHPEKNQMELEDGLYSAKLCFQFCAIFLTQKKINDLKVWLNEWFLIASKKELKASPAIKKANLFLLFYFQHTKVYTVQIHRLLFFSISQSYGTAWGSRVLVMKPHVINEQIVTTDLRKQNLLVWKSLKCSRGRV